MLKTATSKPQNVDEYIAKFAPEVQAILQRVRQVVREAVPDAQEVISYQMPALKVHGIVVYFAAFKHHIGIYPPVGAKAMQELGLAPYAGEKGNLRFPFSQPIPYELIARIAQTRARQDAADAARKRKTSRVKKPPRTTTLDSAD
ncbi:MAG: DUF1801 domain-containing protein [Burkholderiales bacterium]|nr:DUF1801 domain-containing protein [Burkholderiales bacterium]